MPANVDGNQGRRCRSGLAGWLRSLQRQTSAAGHHGYHTCPGNVPRADHYSYDRVNCRVNYPGKPT